MAEAPQDAVSTLPCHLAGITRVTFSPDGRTIFTGGTDCLVRIHDAEAPGSEPGFHDNHTDAITALTCSLDSLLTGCVDSIVRRFSVPGHEFEGFTIRTPGVPVRWVSVDKQGDRVAVCSEDLLVRIVNLKDTTHVALLTDNQKPVRSAAWDPTGKYLVTVGCDAKVKVYDTESSTPVCVKIMDGVVPTSEADAESSSYVAWHPSGNYFAVPSRTNDIGIVNKDGWSKQTTFSADGHISTVTELAWSANGKYLASAAGTQILVWQTDTRQVISRFTYGDGNVSGLEWCPSKNMIAFTAMDGTFNRWSKPVSEDFPSPVLSDAAAAKKVDRLLDDDLDEGLFGDGDLDLEDDGEDIGAEEDFGDDWIVDDVGGGILAKDDTEDRWTKGRTEVVNVTKAQKPFVPGATAWRSKKRYLAFNMIGAVDATDQETHNVVNVEFHDKSARRGYHFSDHAKYTMASLGEQGIVYAAPAGDSNATSVVHYRPYDSWASATDWTVPLLGGEDALAVAAGGPADGMGAVVVATSRGLVRFFTASGIQRYVWLLGDEVVTMVAGRESVLIVHREGGTSLDGCQNLRYSLLDLETFEMLQSGRIPLPRKVMLAWVGFTADGAPAIYDSAGFLSILDRFRRPGQARWVPLLDTAALAQAGRKQHHWPVGISPTDLQCIVLRGAEREPWFPRPLITDVPLSIPVLVGGAEDQARREESFIRGELALSLAGRGTDSAAVVALDKELLQLLQGACKADELSRALDLARLMRFTSSLDAAHKMAGFYHLPGLQEQIARVRNDKERGGGMGRRAASPIREAPARYHGRAADRDSGKDKMSADFAPTNRRRTFGGRTVARAETPVSSAPQTFIPETPGSSAGDNDDFGGVTASPERADPLEGHPLSPQKRKAEEAEFAPRPSAPKNPFAKKAPASNPFARPAVARPLDSVKSTSFFERVDDIEGGKVPASKKRALGKAKTASLASGKQATLFGMGAKVVDRPAAVHQDSMMSVTETEGDDEETQMDDEPAHEHERGVLEESVVQETLVDAAMDDE